MTDETKIENAEDIELTAPDSEPDAAELKKQKAAASHARVNKFRAKEKAKQYVWNSDQEPRQADAEKILQARGIRNSHVLDVVYGLLLTAAEQHDLIPNRFLFANGFVQTMKSREARKAQELSPTSDEPVTGELLTRSELHCLWDSSIAPHETTSFEQFLEIRHNCKTDAFYLGKTLGKDFAECHRVWSHEFFPQFNPDTLPPAYTQRQAINWMNEQSAIKNFLLLASRNSFKSSWSHVWLLTAILCLPDIRVLLVSETRPLSRDFIGAIRGYFESNPESRFQRLFPEYVIPLGDGSSLTLEVPLARLRLPQSIESTSMDSSVAGRRADLILFDDPISSTNSGNETQIAATIAKYDGICKLREVGGLVAVLGTPWAPADLFAVLIKRNEDDEDKPLAVRIDPAWTVKDHAKDKALRELKQEDVILLFPERLSWKFLQSEMRANPQFFMSQNLITWPKAEDADLRCTFTEDQLKEHTKPAAYFYSFQPVKTVLSVDTAFSISRLADFSCLVTTKIMRREDKYLAVVSDCDMDRWTYSDLATHIVLAIQKHRPSEVVIEKLGPWTTLATSIQRAALLRNITLPHLYWRDVDLSPRAKVSRIKALEPMLHDDELFFIEGVGSIEALIGQLLKYDGIKKSSATRKDDGPDSLSLGILTYFPKSGPQPDKTEAQKAAEEAMTKAAQMQDQYRRMFGNLGPGRTGRVVPAGEDRQKIVWSGQEQEPDPEPTNPIDRIFDRNGMSAFRKKS